MVNIHIDQLAVEIANTVREYTEEVSKAIERELAATSKTVLAHVKANSPVKTGRYKAGWKCKKEGSNGSVKYTVYNKDKPSLVHLLEFGHAKHSGGRVAGRPHIRPAYDRYVSTMEGRIKQIIQNGR